ncbi:enoyl-CoA hydratase/isomerase family protein [Nocardioides ginsengisoli]|uniref:Enoyl-CoA hydratase/isomerase family protein n=1 Tax=Nocardioides ginsengisoli TaxID=363868 RepID=A0ABW3VV53_9ACTN
MTADVAVDPSLVRSSYLSLEGGSTLALLTLDRAEQMNPLDHPSVLALRDAIESALARDDVRAIALTGAGRAFSAGGDMKKYLQLQGDRHAFTRFLLDLHGVFDSLATCRVPTIALVNGIAIAGGMELVLACDVAFAAQSARIGDAHLPFGQMGGGGVLSRLPRRVGSHRARELIFSGRILPADEAAAWGLVNRVVPDADLIAAAVDLGNDIARKSPLAVANVKRVLAQIDFHGLGLDDALAFEREVTIDYCLDSQDAREGLEAFSAKRRPEFRGV